MEAPILKFSDCSTTAGTFILNTDASEKRSSGLLPQVDTEYQEHVIAYACRRPSKPPRNYYTTRKEMVALIITSATKLQTAKGFLEQEQKGLRSSELQAEKPRYLR